MHDATPHAWPAASAAAAPAIAALHSPRIDLIRGISICLVLLHHFTIAYRLTTGWAFADAALHALARNGNYGVTLFFTVSGYLITSRTLRRWPDPARISPLRFYRLRAARILPCVLLLLAVVDGLALAGVAIFQNHPEWGEPVPLWVANLASVTFWMNILTARSGWLNYALCVQWSLSVEEVFYAGFPLLCLLCRGRRALLAVWACFVIAGPLWRATHQNDDSGYLYAYLACFDAIAIGCITAAIRPSLRPGAWARPAATAVSAVLTGLYLARSIGVTNIYGVSIMALGCAVLIATETASTATRAVPLQALRACGRLSLELYLFHLVVLGLMRTIWPPEAFTGAIRFALLAAFLALSVALALALSRFFSDPLNAALRGKSAAVPPATRA
jgi:peptidoglycan/LPS O-acetylase OafA/YrhL